MLRKISALRLTIYCCLASIVSTKEDLKSRFSPSTMGAKRSRLFSPSLIDLNFLANMKNIFNNISTTSANRAERSSELFLTDLRRCELSKGKLSASSRTRENLIGLMYSSRIKRKLHLDYLKSCELSEAFRVATKVLTRIVNCWTFFAGIDFPLIKIERFTSCFMNNWFGWVEQAFVQIFRNHQKQEDEGITTLDDSHYFFTIYEPEV